MTHRPGPPNPLSVICRFWIALSPATKQSDKGVSEKTQSDKGRRKKKSRRSGGGKSPIGASVAVLVASLCSGSLGSVLLPCRQTQHEAGGRGERGGRRGNVAWHAREGEAPLLPEEGGL
nr:unnamed protein product [Digitaria exilis]